MQRYSVGQAATLTYTGYDDEETALAITNPATYTIYDGAGTQVDTGAATAAAGVLSTTLSVAKVATLDAYRVLWTGKVGGTSRQWWDDFELVGGYLFSLPAMRAFDAAYADTTKYPTAKLREARTWVEQRIEHGAACGVAFVPRAAREKLQGDGTTRLWLAWPRIRAVYSVTVDGVALTAAELTELVIHDSHIEWANAWTADAEVVIHYEHGYDFPPMPVSEAGLILAREYLVAKSLASRATAESTDVGFYRLSIAGGGGRTGIPEVDAVIEDYRGVRFRIG